MLVGVVLCGSVSQGHMEKERVLRWLVRQTSQSVGSKNNVVVARRNHTARVPI